MNKVILLILILTQFAFGAPKKLEVWFLSLDKTAFIKEIIPQTKFLSMLASNYKCQPMGDYCFDPQIGLYKEDKNKKIIKARDYSNLDSKEEFKEEGEYKEGIYDPCKEMGHFNIFCGKTNKKNSKAKVPKHKLEIWVDISSTMRQIDFKNHETPCFRETFLKRVNKKCSLNEKMKVYIFDESRKELGNFDRVCLNSGLNRVDRLMKDIKSSKAKNLVIITDIYEAKAEFIDFIENEMGGTTKGIKSPVYAKSIVDDVSRIQKMCR